MLNIVSSLPTILVSTKPLLSSVSDPGFFLPDPDQTFFRSPDPDRPKIQIRSGKSGSLKKRPKTGVKVEKNVIFHI